jgi:hypothetical protein
MDSLVVLLEKHGVIALNQEKRWVLENKKALSFWEKAFRYRNYKYIEFILN